MVFSIDAEGTCELAIIKVLRQKAITAAVMMIPSQLFISAIKLDLLFLLSLLFAIISPLHIDKLGFVQYLRHRPTALLQHTGT
jgi:hypothetical protein